MKTPKIQWLEWQNDVDEPQVAQSLEGRFYIHGFIGYGFTLEIREIRYGLKDQPNTVRIIKLDFDSMRAAKRFAQRRIAHMANARFDRADLEVADLATPNEKQL